MSVYFWLNFVQVFVFIYFFIVFISDLTFVCTFSTLGLIAAAIFRLKFALVAPKDYSKFRSKNGSAGSTGNINAQEGKGEIFQSMVIAHRTLALECPENSMAGIRLAAEYGFDGVEFDVRLSNDGVAILFHDSTLDRVTTSTGLLQDFTFEKLQSLDISSQHLLYKSYENERILRLQDAISECLALNLKIIIDVKVPNSKMLSILTEVFQSTKDLENRSMVVSVSPLFLYKLKKINPSVYTGLVWRPQMLSLVCPGGNLEFGTARYREKWKQLLAIAGDPIVDWFYNNLFWHLSGVDAFLPHKDSINKEYARMWKRRNVPLLVWPVNNPIEKTFLSNVMRVDYLTDTHIPFC